jgi:protein-L-isoaspartate(D-aspartate) O-methyltransferase
MNPVSNKTMADERAHMVTLHIEGYHIGDPRVIKAMGQVRREAFVPKDQQHVAYQNRPLPIGLGQTISQPLMVAIMLEEAGLRGDEHVLEVGTGSGYNAALLSLLAKDVVSIERHEKLALRAADALACEGYDNVLVQLGDGTLGCPDHAPFDMIIVTAAAPQVPAALVAQLVPGGRLIIPLGKHEFCQSLYRVTQDETGAIRKQPLGAVSFVPLIGKQGFAR